MKTIVRSVCRVVVLACVVSLLAPGRGRAASILLVANLTGAQEVPGTGSSGTGSGTVLIDDVLMTITVNESWTGLSGPATVSHIHTPALPGATAPVVFPFTGVTLAASGSIPQQVFSVTAAQLTQLESGLAYMNVHTANFPTGEIRGQLGPASVPEPASFIMAGIAVLVGLGYAGRRRQAKAAA